MAQLARSGPRPFNPALRAGVADKTAGAHSSLLNRSDPKRRRSEPQRPDAHDPARPSGHSGRYPLLPRCRSGSSGRAQLFGPRRGGKPELSGGEQIGTADTGAGAGTHPVYLPGKVYLAGPYKGAPLSLAVITPAVSGPYDLGNVVVRAALHVNPETAQITAVSDPLPQILQGIPLRLRSILIELNRQNFTLNPTNCDPFSVGSQVSGNQGAQASSQLPLPGRRLRRPALRPQARPEALRLHQAQRQPGAHRDPHRQARTKPTSPAPRSPCRPPSSSTTPTSRTPAPGSSSPKANPRRTLPGRLGDRLRQGRRPRCSKSRSKARSICARRQKTKAACPTSSPP